MATWEGRWRFENAMNSKDGSCGMVTVEADDRPAAKRAAKIAASRRLFGDERMQAYMQITPLRRSTR
jgi:hypothetical protein